MFVPTYTVKHYIFAASDDFWGTLPFSPQSPLPFPPHLFPRALPLNPAKGQAAQ